MSIYFFFKYVLRDLNPRPSSEKPDALPNEPSGHKIVIVYTVSEGSVIFGLQKFAKLNHFASILK